MYYSLNLKKKTVGRSIIFLFPLPPTPPSRLLKGRRDFRFGVFFKVSNNIWNLMTNFSKIEWFRFQISLMGGGGRGCSPMRWAEIYSLGIQPKSFEDSDFIVLYDKHTLDWFVLKLIICNFSQVTLRFAHGLEKAVSQQQGGYQFFRNTFVFLCKMMLP